MNEVEELKAENERLKREYDILDGIIDLNNAKIGQLEKENKQLKELFEIESLTDIKTGETMYRSRQIIHFVDILQEIKEIAEKRFVTCSDTYCDKQRKTKECNPKVPCNAYLLRQILQVIKAEEE